ncbi:hypothetical protein C8Q73DRAFT_287367 [Cubamyces lactineus]|nr:hypothetical protein C8Q73DRAFT_287367 [Cubamyces lactineus]
MHGHRYSIRCATSLCFTLAFPCFSPGIFIRMLDAMTILGLAQVFLNALGTDSISRWMVHTLLACANLNVVWNADGAPTKHNRVVLLDVEHLWLVLAVLPFLPLHLLSSARM